MNKIIIAVAIVIALLYFGGEKVTGIISGISNAPPSFLVPLVDKVVSVVPFMNNVIFMGIKFWVIILLVIGAIVALSIMGF